MRNTFGTYLKSAFRNQYNYIAMALFGGLGTGPPSSTTPQHGQSPRYGCT